MRHKVASNRIESIVCCEFMIWQQSKTIVNDVCDTDLMIKNDEKEKVREWLLCIYDIETFAKE